MTPHEEHNPQHGIPPINEGLIIDTLRTEAERQRQEQETRDENTRQRQARHDRQMLRVTQGLLLATFITGIAALYQTHVSSRNADAAMRAVSIAEAARDDSTISGGDTLIQMKAQNRAMRSSSVAMQKAADASTRQVDKLEALVSATQQGVKTASEQERISQRAAVTIGKKDGTIADVVIPKDPNQSAEIVIYFQNSGHLPAKFSWGTVASLLSAASKQKSTGITYTHPFEGLGRTKNRIDGSIGDRGNTYIAGDSVLVQTLGTIPQNDLARLPTNDMGVLIMGFIEYCDELGTHSLRQFSLVYQSNTAPSTLGFRLINEIPFPEMPLAAPTATTEYLPPCETFAEREQSEKRQEAH